MTPVSIVITFKGRQLQRQIRCRPEDRLIQALAADSPDQSLDERMREWNVRNRFDFCYAQDSQAGLPLMKPVERIVIRTESLMTVPATTNHEKGQLSSSVGMRRRRGREV